MRAINYGIIENMIWTNYISCFKPRVFEILAKKMKILKFVCRKAAVPFDFCGGRSVVLENFGKLENFGMFFFKYGKFWKLWRTLENYVILFPKKEANYDAMRGIYLHNLDQTSVSKS